MIKFDAKGLEKEFNLVLYKNIIDLPRYFIRCKANFYIFV